MIDFVSKNKPINPTNEKINCLHPVIITNPNLKDLLYVHGNFTYDGKLHTYSGSNRRAIASFFPKRYFRPSPDIGVDDLDKYFVTDYSTGESFPMYLAVPCGHCEICKGSKIDAFAHRCELETQCYNSLPYFITLTYNDEHLPKDGLSVSDTQFFLKRLRSRLVYAGYKEQFRYVVCGQYGSNGTHRAHYHLIIWNLAPFSGCKFKQLRRIIHKSWNKGFTYTSIVSPNYVVRGSGHKLSKPEDCFKYVGRYICHDGEVPPGKNRMFINTSRRKGGVGAPFLDRHSYQIRKYMMTDFHYFDKFSQTVKSLVYCRYNLNRLFPTRCMSIPLELRNAVRRLCLSAPLVENSFTYMNLFKGHFDKVFWPLLRLDDLRTTHNEIQSQLECPFLREYNKRMAFDDLKILCKYWAFDFAKSIDLDSKRHLLVSKLFEHKKVSYLVPIAYRRKRYMDLAKQREVF